ncbi:MAG: sigma-70 family RNA polymerase sigma factor [Bacteroidales bacterium]|nr:sigma-70 family RNA polymerase sigma factor [Bacteroidales bacterium]
MAQIPHLLRQIKDEDSETAFRQLFDLQYDRLFRRAVFLLRNDDWAKEVALDVLAEVWNNRKQMTIPDDFDRYSMTMVRNAAVSLWRREQRYADFDAADAPESAIDAIDQQIAQEELFLVYDEALANLPARCREVWQLVKEEGLTYAEVAARLGISPKTVDAQLQKAVKHLRAVVGSYLERESASSPLHPMRSLILSMLCL